MKKYYGAGGFLWFFIGISTCIGSVRLDLGGISKPGSGFVPFLSGALMAVSGLILIFTRRSKEEVKSEKIWVKENWKKVFCAILAMLGYVILLDLLGFVVTTFIFLFFLFKLTEPKKWVMPLVYSGSAVVLSYLIFSVWLQSEFPKGIFGF